MVFAFLGTPEIIIILVIALVVFGPQKLPEIGRQVGSALRELNKMRSDVQRAFDIDDLTRDHSTYGSTSHYDSSHYGTTYPAATTYESSHMLESHSNPSGEPIMETETTPTPIDDGQMSLEYEPLKTPEIAEPTALPYTVSISAGAAVAHDIDNHEYDAASNSSHGSNGVSTNTASPAMPEHASATAATVNVAEPHDSLAPDKE